MFKRSALSVLVGASLALAGCSQPQAGEPAPSPQPTLSRASGEAVAPKEGLPTVALNDQGEPEITLPGGEPPQELVIQVLQRADERKVKYSGNLTVHYKGVNWSTGEVFDSSWSRGEPATFPLAQVIPGWQQGLAGQSVGSQVLLVVPPNMAYGEQGSPPSIGPNETLVFVVDILAAT